MPAGGVVGHQATVAEGRGAIRPEQVQAVGVVLKTGLKVASQSYGHGQ